MIFYQARVALIFRIHTLRISSNDKGYYMEQDRPIECTSCKKKASITYREIQEGKVSTVRYCADCPILKDKISVNVGEQNFSGYEIEKNVLCQDCKTSLHSVMTGAPFGCKRCYETFEEFLTQELEQSGAIPSTKTSLATKKKMPLHLGNVPSKVKSPDFANKLRSLNTALHEALAIENYERAANLRDQIKLLMEQSPQD